MRKSRNPILAIASFTIALSVPALPALAVDTGRGYSSGSAGSSSVNVSREMEKARTFLAAEKWAAADRILRSIVKADKTNADAYNLLGFANRKLNRLKFAGRFYERALKLEPAHLGALEYQGELFLMLNQVSSAQANLAELRRLCGTGCEEYQDLKAAVDSYAGT